MKDIESGLNDGHFFYDFFSDLSEENDEKKKENVELTKRKWLVSNNFYLPIADSCDILESGYYTVHQDSRGNVGFLKQTLRSDDLYLFTNSIMNDIVKEIEKFWSKEKTYRENGILHRRGILLHGQPGNGKSATLFQIMQDLIHKKGIALSGNCKPTHLIDALKDLRRIEPNRKIICILEDLDKIIKEHGEDKLLALLDGEDKTNSILFIATSNTPELLGRSFTARPKRFDRLYFLDYPDESIRREYIKYKIKDISNEQLEKYVRKTNKYSFASLAELIVSVICLDYTLEDALKTLNGIQDNKISSSDYYNNKLGFQSE